MRQLPSPSEPSSPTAATRNAYSRTGLAVALMGAALLAGCGEAPPPPPVKLTPVRAETVEIKPFAPTVTLTGTIAAGIESNQSFRTAGRMAERRVDVGDHVGKGDVLATLDTEEQQADLDAARASLGAAEATLRQAQTTFERQKQLLAGGFTTKSSYDNAAEAVQAAEGTLAAAKADVGTSEDALAYTALRADAAGIITARNAEAGQVVDAAQTIFTLAQDGERQAVFDIYESLLAEPPSDNGVSVSLVSDPNVKVMGKVDEIAPIFDTTGGTVRVKVGLGADLPAAMTLGAAVAGVAQFAPHDAITLPWTALSADAGKPSVWVVDPGSQKVAQRPIVVDRYRTGEILVSKGLKAGEVVITAGAQLLREGQAVALTMGAAQ
jgi:RND family efflux transporter MFP subunit